jgi:hypothetical protein
MKCGIAAQAIGNHELQVKFEGGKLIRRDIVGSAL